MFMLFLFKYSVNVYYVPRTVLRVEVQGYKNRHRHKLLRALTGEGSSYQINNPTESKIIL